PKPLARRRVQCENGHVHPDHPRQYPSRSEAPVITDTELVRQYVHDRSSRAFEELVRRHIDWVHGVAMRAVRDRALADDVTQAVFAVLAQKAKTLREGTVLSAWLFGVTRLTSAE